MASCGSAVKTDVGQPRTRQVDVFVRHVSEPSWGFSALPPWSAALFAPSFPGLLFPLREVPHTGRRGPRGIGVVRTGRSAPSPSPRGTPPRTSGLGPWVDQQPLPPGGRARLVRRRIWRTFGARDSFGLPSPRPESSDAMRYGYPHRLVPAPPRPVTSDAMRYGYP